LLQRSDLFGTFSRNLLISLCRRISKKISSMSETSWFVYMLRCSDGSLYTGVTTDVTRRVKEHNGEGGKGKGAKYTKAHRPVVLAYQELVPTRSEAQIREAQLRKLSKLEKETLVKK
jgi:putative endonuclease